MRQSRWCTHGLKIMFGSVTFSLTFSLLSALFKPDGANIGVSFLNTFSIGLVILTLIHFTLFKRFKK
jgi:hypothetical protein